MKKLGKWDYRVVRFHGNKAEAEKMQMQAMRALGGFLLTCQEHMEICGPWEMKFDDGTIFNLRQNYDIPIIDIFVPTMSRIFLKTPGLQDGAIPNFLQSSSLIMVSATNIGRTLLAAYIQEATLTWR
jgi:hypothetical protein